MRETECGIMKKKKREEGRGWIKREEEEEKNMKEVKLLVGFVERRERCLMCYIGEDESSGKAGNAWRVFIENSGNCVTV